MEIMIILALLAVIVFSALSFFMRKPGPKGEKGDKGERGRDGFICDDLTTEHLLELLKKCDEISLENTTITVRDIKKQKKTVK